MTDRKALIDGLVGGDELSRRESRRKLSAALEYALLEAGDPVPLRGEIEALRNAGWSLIGQAEYGEGEYTLAAAIETLTTAARRRAQLAAWLPLVVDQRLKSFMQAPVADLNMAAWSTLDLAITEADRLIRGSDESIVKPAGGASAASSVRPRIPLRNNALELGMSDEAVLSQIFSELRSAPETLLPEAMPILTHTAFLLWKIGRSAPAKQLLFVCLAWFLQRPDAVEDIALLTEDIKYVFAKEGRALSDSEVHAMAKGQT